MLTLCTGADRTALSRHLADKLVRQAAAEPGQILLVPEQFSHEAERTLCQVGGDGISRYAEVLSFSRLWNRVAAAYGGAARAYLDQGGRLLAMALAAEQTASKIHLYASVLRRPEFLADLVKMTEEFQSYCLTPTALLEAAGRSEGQFAQKLTELALLYEGYLALTAQGAADPAEKLAVLADRLVETDWAASHRIWVDGFSDFTGAELRVLEALLRRSRGLTVALTTGDAETAITRPVRETARSLRLLAAQWSIPVTVDRVTARQPRDPGVQALLDCLFGGAAGPFQAGSVSLTAYEAVEDECRGAALRVKQLLARGSRCRDISLGLCDPGLYEGPLRAAFAEAGLPLYLAGETDLLSKPVYGAVLSALAAAAGPLDYEDAALYLKSGLPLEDRDWCDRLDGYAFRWNLHGSLWEQDWTFHPRGYGEDWTDGDRAALAALNTHRQTALAELLTLRRAIRAAGTTGEMTLALADFLDAVQLRERLAREAEARLAAGENQMAQELRQLYDILRDCLEQLWLALGPTPRTPDGFVRLVRTLLSQYAVGTIPAGLDQVLAGPLPDLRQRRTKHLLVLGTADGAFPAYRGAEGLLTEEERRRLLAQGISLAPSRADQLDQEMGRIAAALAAAEDTIALSYAGEQPAWLFRRAARAFPASVSEGPAEVFLSPEGLAAFDLRHGSERDLPGLSAVRARLKARRDYDFTALAPETVAGLYGKTLYLSASRIDKYAGCRLSYFLAYGLKAQPRKQAKLDPSAFGTFVHAVLEATVGRVHDEGGFPAVSAQRLTAIAVEEMDRYAAQRFPQQAQRAAHLFRRARREVLDVVLDLGEELHDSRFQPAGCELEFSAQGALPPVEIAGQTAVCRVSGFVDRVDLCELDGKTYVRVVDYKTGQKDFDYTDILYGAGLQMLIYLFALQAAGGAYFGRDALIPAGVLYLPARQTYTLTQPQPSEEEVRDAHREERRRRGLILGWDQILAAMEADPAHPRFMPYQIKKGEAVGNLATAGQLALLERHVTRTLAKMADQIAAGAVGPNPVQRGSDGACKFCDYQTVCHGDLCPRETRNFAATDAATFWQILEEEDRHG